MYRIRFENLDQIFDIPDDVQIVVPLRALNSCIHRDGLPDILKDRSVFAEIPSVLWEHSIDRVREELKEIKTLGISDVLCENVGAVNICRDLGMKIHGGMYLNVLNSVAIQQYERMGAETLTLSFEMPFGKIRALLGTLPEAGKKLAMVVYGYLPLMKFRACPAMGPNGCKGCTRDKYLRDRKGENFRILCRNSEYSELLNCVPLYAADKALPETEIKTLYFTVESKEECKNIFHMVVEKKTPEFRRTAGLYGRELL